MITFSSIARLAQNLVACALLVESPPIVDIHLISDFIDHCRFVFDEHISGWIVG